MHHHITTPPPETLLRTLACGDAVTLSGTIFTARDAAHKYLAGTPDPKRLPALNGAVLYHCGPVIVPACNSWRVTAAGPTTSIREEPYMADIIRRYGIRAVIGKGGMGAATAAACRDCGCVYLSATGGAAQVLASAVKRVCGVYMLDEFGGPEAIWELEVQDFPAVVTMDCTGASLHAAVREHSAARLGELFGR